MNCSNCNAVLSENMLFCTNCGQKVEKPEVQGRDILGSPHLPPPPPPQSVIIGASAADIPADDVPETMQIHKSEPVPEAAPQAAEPVYIPPPEPSVIPQYVPEAQPLPQTEQPVKKPRKTGLVIAAVFICVFLVAGATVAAIHFEILDILTGEKPVIADHDDEEEDLPPAQSSDPVIPDLDLTPASPDDPDPADEADTDEIIAYLEEHFADMAIDGSTSMIPLHASLRKLFLNLREEYVPQHSKTVDAFNKLIAGENDILFGVDFNDELLKEAEDSGIDLVKLPITREAFVFVINKENPVQDLTTEQIKAIYSGEITNWSELGGDDAPIEAFQRNADSGSQIRMVKFMGDTPLMEANVTYINQMGAVIEKVGDAALGKYTIAYNMYTFTERQYFNDNVMLLSVDGVKPTDETIFDDSYPIIIYNYLYYDANNAKAAEFAEQLHLYLMSEQGQQLINDAGYVNLHTAPSNRNKDNPYSYHEWDYENYIGFYNEETGEFRDVIYPDGYNQPGELITFPTYADFVLRGGGTPGARDFLTMIYESNIELSPFTTYVGDGVLGIAPFFDAVFDPDDYFTFRFDDKYYAYFLYNINEDKIYLQAADWSEWYFAEHEEHFPQYIANYEYGAILEITWEDLDRLYFGHGVYNWVMEVFVGVEMVYTKLLN